jgi:menaquinol-cytochrome c reductase cytochrome b/c subunit
VVEIPEHLRKRAEDARRKAEASKPAGSGGGEAAGESGETKDEGQGSSRIPSHLLERSRAARERAAGGEEAAGGGGTAVATAPEAPPGTTAPPPAAGPDGHTQRLLTVVKAGSIQDVKASPQDKVHVWPHLLAIEFVAALAITAFVLVFSVFVNAPLLELANPNQTPNPSKAPWYFLGLQELLTMFHPMVAGVTIPTVALIGLILAPYTDRNPSSKPEDRKFAISLFTLFLMTWAVLVLMSSFFRGPGFNFIFPWNDGLFFEL